jgi:hypothetical protein
MFLLYSALSFPITANIHVFIAVFGVVLIRVFFFFLAVYVVSFTKQEKVMMPYKKNMS